MRRLFFLIFIPVLVVLTYLIWWWPAYFILFYFLVVSLFLLGLYDVVQRAHSVLRNFPLLGRFRFILEAIRPEIFQYFVEADWEGRPLNRLQRSVVYQRAKGVLDTLPYGTRKDLNAVGTEYLAHSLRAKFLRKDEYLRQRIGEGRCKKPYSACFLNISAMSYGALSPEAIMTMNWGAKEGNFFQNTGEGGISPYHLKYGGDLVWQIGTGYFGCRTQEGKFCEVRFQEKSQLDAIKMIEIKLSQGAKPGHGGILPAAKVNQEVAEIRHVPLGQDVISPPAHHAFSTPIELLEFIERLRNLSDKPIGIKFCLGILIDFFCLCKAMLLTHIVPDFITIDGAEGGTGAAPLEFSNAVGIPLADALPFVHSALMGIGMRDRLKLIAAGKLTTGFEIVSMMARGADMCNQARAMMLATGCIMSLKCHTNQCPTGVATQDKAFRYGLVVKEKYKRVYLYHQETVRSVMELVGAAGLDCYTQIRPEHVYRRVSSTEVRKLNEVYEFLEPGALLEGYVPKAWAEPWKNARAERWG